MSETNEDRYICLISRYNGFFSNVFGVLGLLHECDKQDCIPALKFDTGIYYDPARASSWWDNYFLPLSTIDTSKIERTGDLLQSAKTYSKNGARQTFEQSHKLIEHHIQLQPHIQDKIKTFVAEHFAGHYVIGILYRGTDMICVHSGVPVPVDYAAEHITQFTDKLDVPWRLLVASCEQQFVDGMLSAFPENAVALDSIRSDGITNPHFDPRYDAFAYKKGEDCILTAMLLAHCDFFFHTRSGITRAVFCWRPSLRAHSFDLTVHRKKHYDDRKAIAEIKRQLEPIVSGIPFT